MPRLSKQARAMRELPYNGWQLDNSVGVQGGKAQHRTWRPVVKGRPVYNRYYLEDGEWVREGPLLYTFCGREAYLNPPHPAPRCGVCFRGAIDQLAQTMADVLSEDDAA